MEITTLDKKNCLRIKGKHASLIIDPSPTVKTTTDGVLFSKKNNAAIPKSIEVARLIVLGAGEYEVGGIKIATQAYGDEFVHIVTLDSITVCFIPTSLLEKLQEKMSDCNILAILVNGAVKDSVVASYDSRVIILYGEHLTDEAISSFDKQNIITTAKFLSTADKLPEEMQVILLK